MSRVPDTARARFEQQIGAQTLRGRAVNQEATSAAVAGQRRSRTGSREDPLYGGPRFAEIIDKMKTMFKTEPCVSNEGRLAAVIEKFLVNPKEVLDKASEGSDTFHVHQQLAADPAECLQTRAVGDSHWPTMQNAS